MFLIVEDIKDEGVFILQILDNPTHPDSKVAGQRMVNNQRLQKLFSRLLAMEANQVRVLGSLDLRQLGKPEVPVSFSEPILGVERIHRGFFQ